MAQKIYLKKSSVVDRTPQTNSLEFGELTINYASGTGKAFLAHKKYDGTIAKYHEDDFNDAKFASKGELSQIQSSLSNYATHNEVKNASGNAITSAYTMAKDYIDSAIEGIAIGNYLTVESATSVFNGYDSSISNIQSKLTTFALSATVKSSISALTKTIEDDEYVIAQAFNSVNDRLENLEGSAGDYLTVDSASSIVSNLTNQIGNAVTKANSAFNYTAAVSATVKATYWDSATTQSKIGSASGYAYNQATAYTSNNYVAKTTYNEYTGNVSNTIATLQNSVGFVSGSVSAMSSNVVTYINDKLSTVYVYKGTVNNYSDLPNSGKVVGYTYNVVNANGNIPAGTNYAWNGSAWDPLGGSVDLSGYATTDTVSQISSLANNLKTGLSAWTYNNAATHTEVGNASSNTLTSAATSATSIATAKANDAAQSALTRANEYTDSKTSGLSDIQNTVTSLKTNLSAWTYNNAATHTEVGNASSHTLTSAATSAASIATVKANDAAQSALTRANAYTDSKTSAISDIQNNVTALKTGLSAWTYNNAATHTEVGNASSHTLTSAATSASSIAIAKANDAAQSALTRANAYTDSKTAPISEIQNSITTINNKLANVALSARVDTLVENLTTTIEDNEVVMAAALTDLDSRIRNFSGNMSDYVLVSTYETYTGNTASQISKVATSAQSAYTYAALVDNNLKKGYWTSGTTKQKIDAAVTSAATSAVTYANNTFVSHTQFNEYSGGVNSTLSKLRADVNYASATTSGLSANVVTYINNKLSSVYVYKGSVANVASLPTTGQVVGYVYNVVAASGTPGEASYVPAGTNYAWNDSAWDPLGGTVDLSNYATTGRVSDVEATATALKTGLSAWTYNNAATHNEVKTASGNAITSAVTSANNYTDSRISATSGQLVTNTQFGSYSSATENRISNINNSLTAFSSTVLTTYATKDDASEYSAAALGNAMAYTDSKISGIGIGNYLTVESANSIVTTLNNNINKAATSAQSAYTYANSINTNLTSNYYTKTDANTQIANASARSFTSAKTYVDGNYLPTTSANSIVTTLNNNINKAATSAQSAYTYANNINTNLTNNYYTKTDANTQIANASARTFNSGKTYADATFLTVTSASSKFSSIDSSISNVNTALTAFSATVINDFATKTEASSYAAAALANSMAYTDSKISGLSIGNYLTVDSANSIVTTLNNSISKAATSAQSAYTYANTINTNLTNNYYTKTDANTQIANASARSFTSAKTYVDSNYLPTTSANSIVTTLNSNISKAATSAQSAYTYANTINTNLTNNYYTKTDANTQIANASARTFNSGKTYADATFLTITSASSKFTSIDSSVSNLTTGLNSLSGSVINNYATDAKASNYAAAALANAMDYTDSKISGIGIGNYLTVSSANSIVSDINNKIANEHASAVTLSGSVTALSASVISKLTNVYTYKGTVANASNLPTTGQVAGYVYNVTNASGTPGTATYIPAGTNWAWNGSAWDPLGGTVDLSAYLTASSANTAYTNLTNSINKASSSAQSAYTYADTINTTLKNGYWNSATTKTKIDAAVTSAATSAVTYANNTFLKSSSAVTMYSNLTNLIDGVVSSLGDYALSGTVNDLIGVVEEGQEVTAAALTDLDNRIRMMTTTVGNYLTIDSATSVHSELSSSITNAMNAANSAFNYTEAVSATVVGGYWDSATTQSKIGSASGYAYNQAVASASAYTKTVSGNLASAISDINSSLTGFVKKTGDTMTGVLTMKANMYTDAYDGALNMNNSDIYGLNSIYTADKSDTAAEGIHFFRTTTTVDTLRAVDGVLKFFPNRTVGSTAGTEYNVYHTGNLSPVTLNTDQTIASAKTFTKAITANGGITVQTAASFSNVWRAVPFSTTASPYNNIMYVNSNANSGLTYNPLTGKLRAYGFVINGKAATDLLTADGGVTTVATVTGSCVPTTRKVNGHALSADVTVTKGDLGLGNVENTALSTWTGNTSIKSVGTITAGTWTGTKIGLPYLAQSAITIDGTLTGLGGSVTTKNLQQENVTSANYRPLLLGSPNNAAQASIPTTTVTGTSYFNKEIYAQPSTGELGATQMKVGGHVTLQYNSTTQALDFIFS